MNLLNELARSILNGDTQKSVGLCQELIDMGYDANEIINDGLSKGMNMLNDHFEKEEKFVPQILMSARAMNSSIEFLQPFVCGGAIPLNGTIIIGTVEGDVHNIGKGLVSLMLQASCFNVVDLGTNVAKDEFIKAIRDNKASIVALSAMLTTVMDNMKNIIKTINETDFGWPVYILIGGAPITDRYASEIKVVFAEDAIDAKDKAIRLMENIRI
ncbi:5-methyltetrahydrofolate--homocysteine methyltransferase [Dethiosulfatibacter aminovorans DSM 17477]|uniref:5-methyltetrahydrofolate--homocysteine methyltransferase n=1 Tax=Dethiosulfatibacter aminovorans DSM 17477 TaxID=1121476 RepID=A0A1M6LJ81_9FIRM|nr:cobalamin-dependent protein [Dethiosulfatibacter aminovorans]SHJ71243.1 5-methyltetrahydrofolate--homocysteine methyltransferase [Dethiosulfatibacter aminovorans DSM 17477]